MFFKLLAIIVVLVPVPLSAEPLTADRPDFTESPLVVGKGRHQLEGGYLFTYDESRESRLREHGFPQLLLRSGISEKLELRVSSDGYVYTREKDRLSTENDNRVDGLGDVGLGLKFNFISGIEGYPDLGVIVETTLPVGSSEIGEDEPQPGIKFLWAYDLTTDVSVAGNLNISSALEDGERYLLAESSVSFAYGLTDAIGAYVEYFGLYPNNELPEGEGENYLNGGFTYLIDDDLQIDIYTGFGLNNDAVDLFAGSGFAWRI